MVFTFSLDKILNPHLPGSQIDKLPSFIARFLGQSHKLSKKPKPDYILWIDVLIGTFVGLLTLEGIFKSHTVFKDHGAPVIIASYGATAILLFNVNQVPLAQPRNILFGQFLSSLVGVIILKLFQLSNAGTEHKWIGGALATAIASVVMSIFNCVHPPSGATALIPLVDESVGKMGWWYIPTHLVSSVVIIGVGLITNNILRSYPVYWWTAYTKPTPKDEENDLTSEDTNVDQNMLRKVDSQGVKLVYKNAAHVVIGLDNIEVANGLELSDVEYLALDAIRLKLKHLSNSSLNIDNVI